MKCASEKELQTYTGIGLVNILNDVEKLLKILQLQITRPNCTKQ